RGRPGGPPPADPAARLDRLLRHDVSRRPAALPGVLRSAEVPAGKLQGDVLRVLGDGERRNRDEDPGAILPVSAGTVRGLVAVCIMGTIALLTSCGAAAADKSSGGLAGSPSESTAPETMPSHPSPSPSSTSL